MIRFKCTDCGENFYSAAPLHCLRDPHCSCCGGDLKQVSERAEKRVGGASQDSSPGDRGKQGPEAPEIDS
ncbi:MAG: hypothetical protein ACLFN4_00005 [Candidatus Acetothermia bacterium]